MKNRDHIIFIIGNVLIIASYIIKFKDADIASIIQILGLILVGFFIVRGAIALIKKRMSQSN